MTLEEIASVMSDAGMTLDVRAAERNPYISGEAEGMRHFLCELSGRRFESFDFYVSATPGTEMDDASIISLVLEDVKVYRGCPGYDDFLRLMGVDDGEDRTEAAVAWEEMERLAPLVDKAFPYANTLESRPEA